MASAAVGTKRVFASLGEGNGGTTDLYRSYHTSKAREVTPPESTRLPQRRKLSADGMPSIMESTRSTPRATPAPVPSASYCRRAFRTDASIVLLGMPGTGKSTLAVIASMACRRRVLDMDDMFQETTGFSTARYRKQFGAANYNLRQEELLRNTLREHDQGAIIVCNGVSLERNGQSLIQEFGRAHPVVHVLRDLPSLHSYLGGPDLQRLKDMLAFTAPMLRRCSNYEFYNVSEIKVASSDASADHPVAPAFLTLKRAQRTFLKFLSIITNPHHSDSSAGPSIPPLEPGYPLSDVATELRKYTCAVQVSLQEILAEHADVQSLEMGSDAFEILLDLNQQPPATELMDDVSACISKVRRSTVVPIIYHVIPTSTGDGSQTLYLEHVRHGLRLAPEYASVDLSLDAAALADVIASRGTTKIIGHLHADTTWDDHFWVAQYELAVRLGCSVARFTRPAYSIDDDVSVRNFSSRMATHDGRIPLVCYNTGRAGRRSVCFNKYLTPVVAPSTREKADTTPTMAHAYDDSRITAQEVTQALYTSFTFDPMRMYIIGKRLGYSVSPAMHNIAYRTCGMPHEFNRIESPSLDSLKELVQRPNWGGSIVIQPFKMEVIALVDSLSQHARAIGAINTVIPVRRRNSDGSVPCELELFQERNQSGPIQALYGDNTEWIGIRSCVRRGLSPANAVRPSSCGLIIGAGGMARAAVYALLQLGVRKIVIFNRTYERAESLVAHFSRLVSSSTEKATTSSVTPRNLPDFKILASREEPWPLSLRQPTIIISCIPTDPIDGGPAAQFTLPPQWLESPTGGIVMETAYKTLNTPLMQQVRDAPNKLWTYMDGLDFIPEQAFAQFELFTDDCPAMTTRQPLQTLSPPSANIFNSRYAHLQRPTPTARTNGTDAMEERSHNQEDMHDADSLVSGLSSLEDDAEDEFDKLMIRNERDQRRLSQATGGRPQAFTKARTHPRVGLTLDNLERNNATAESSANDKSDRRRSSSGSTKSDPAIHAPASWGRKSRTSRTWMRTITHEEEEQQQQTPVAADDDDYDDANVPRRSFEDSPLSHKSMHGTPRNDEDDEWDLTFELNEASMIASTPYIPRSTVLDDIRQREVESSKEQAAAAARLHRIREGSPEQKHRRRPSSTRTTENANSGAAKPEPAVQQPSPPQKRLRSRTQSWQSIGKSQPVTGMGREDMPPVMYKSAESIATVDREVVATAQRIPPKRIPHRRQDSQDLLRRLARASNTPSPARPQTTPPEPRNSPSETIPSETLKKDGKENAIEEAPVPDAVPDPAAPAEVHTEQKESQEASHGDEQPPKQSTETRVETDDVDATPMPVERPVLNPKTPVVTGAWVDTPGPRTVQRPATTETSRSRSQSPKKSSLRKEKSPERPQAPSEEDAPVSTALEVVRPQLPRSALQALVEGAKNQDRRSSADFGDSTINSLEDLITPLTEIAMDEDTLQGLQIPTATPRNDAERQRQQELLHLHRMNDRLRAARTSIRDASRGMKRVEDQVEHVEEGENGEMIKVINRSCPCATKGHAQSFSMLRWWKSLFWEQRLKTLRQTSNSRGKIWGGLTGLSIFLILFFTWWISEEIACEMYCRPMYAYSYPYPFSVNPYAPKYPFVIPTLIYRTFIKGWWVPISSFLSWICATIWSLVFGFQQSHVANHATSHGMRNPSMAESRWVNEEAAQIMEERVWDASMFEDEVLPVGR
ncbi:quinate pathway repressor protein [Stemphylium lycopersici]|uniref:Quinate pathway repressor protein n=1 Tax=Stemphylium lycopersici TaxID=183478 RepID=A0A364MYN4_STELY|nr:quinate pathway repressor protein [Stemphylium lycopersici]